MEITFDKTSSTEALIKITLIESDYQPQVTQKIKDYGKKATLKGFRPGKVPAGIIKKMYGKSILVEEINNLLSKSLSDYIKDNELQVLGDPIPDEDKASSIDWDNQTTYDFEYKLGLAEDFEVKIDSKTKVETYTIKVDDSVIKETIENLQQQMGESLNPKISEEGDSLYGSLRNEELEIEKDTSLSLEALSKKARKEFIGKKQNDAISFNPLKAFEEKSEAAIFVGKSEDELKKAKSDFTFTIANINRVTPAKVDQELFDKTFGKDTVKSEEEFKAKVKEAVAGNYSKEGDIYLKKAIQDTITNQTKFDLPNEFLKDWLLRSNEGKVSQEDIEKEYDDYAKELKWSLIKNKIIKSNDLKVEHEDVIAEAKTLIKNQLAASGMAGEQFESNLDAFADNYLKGENGENYMKVYNQVLDNQVLDHIKENVTVKSKEVSVKEFRKLPLN